MSMATINREATSKVGRPKRTVPTSSVKVEVDAIDLVRKAATFLGEDMVEYASRVLRERALQDLRDGARQFLADDAAARDPAPRAKKDPSPKR
jgi:hypothetical protein